MSQPIPYSAAPNLNEFMVYDYEVDLAGDSAAARVIAMVGKNKKVLEVGAGSGAITRHLVRTNNCEVVALEINPDSIKKLEPICKSIYSSNLNDVSWPDDLAAEGKFDAVIAADVLEHVYDPWTVLKGMKSLLNEGGFIVLSLPHVGHCALLSCMIEEDFEYREWGLMDKTHIRFFGIHNIQALYESAGMEIEDAKFVVRTPEETEFADRWSRLPAETRNALSSNRFGHVYQVITKAVPAEKATKPIRLADVPVAAPKFTPVTERKGLFSFLTGK
jgi:2-polyprenyl-3-methyl-5-hydroxy-6-metoxy-1,4-benzoquinol methylase